MLEGSNGNGLYRAPSVEYLIAVKYGGLILKPQFGTTERMPRSKSGRRWCCALWDGAHGEKAILLVGSADLAGEWCISGKALFCAVHSVVNCFFRLMSRWIFQSAQAGSGGLGARLSCAKDGLHGP